MTTVAVHPTCIPYSKAAEKRSPPPGEDCAYLLDPGEVHDGPPRRTHSIGDLIQRKEQCTSQIVPVDIISDLSFERRFSAINSPASGFN